MAKNQAKLTSSDRDGKLFNFRPITFCALFLALGILLGFFVVVKGSSWLFGLPIVVVAFGVVAFSLVPKRWIIGVAILCLCTLLGALSFYGSVANFDKKQVYDGEYAVTGVVEEKSLSLGGYAVVLDGVTIDGQSAKGKMIAYLPATLGKTVRLADQIVLVGVVKTNTDLENDYGFRASSIVYKEYYRLSKVEELVVVDSAPRPLLHLRQRIYDVLEAGLDEQAAAFAAGLLLGDDSRIERGLLTNIRGGGIAHLFAVSGLHIGVLFALCLRVTKSKFFQNKHKIFSWLFTALMLVAYGGVCGFSPSIFRAVFICLLAYAYKLIGLKRDGLEAVSLAALALLAFAPAYLFDVGFLLSFSACYGILLFARPMAQGITLAAISLRDFWRYKVCKRKREEKIHSIFEGDTPPDSIGVRAGKKVTSFASVTLAAWLATSAVMLGYFRNLSLWGLLFNFLFIPVLSTFFLLLLALVVLSLVLPLAAAPIVLFLPNAVLGVVILIFELLPLPAVEIPFLVVGFICLYLGLLCTTDKFNLSKRTKRMMTIVALLAAIVCFVAPIFV